MSEALALVNQPSPEGRFSYAEIEDAMLAVFRVPAQRRGALRGLLKKFGTLGLFSLLGKGRRRSYSLTDAVKVALVLQAHALGVSPTLLAPLWGRSDVECGISNSLSGVRVRVHMFRAVGEVGFKVLVQENNVATFDDSICINLGRIATRVANVLVDEEASDAHS